MVEWIVVLFVGYSHQGSKNILFPRFLFPPSKDAYVLDVEDVSLRDAIFDFLQFIILCMLE
jgi:hypothetical protein